MLKMCSTHRSGTLHTWFRRNCCWRPHSNLDPRITLQSRGSSTRCRRTELTAVVYDSSRTLFDGKPPPHFYGELVKTPEGCEILADSGHFARFADFIQQHGLEDYDTEVIARLKSVLWAVVRFPFAL